MMEDLGQTLPAITIFYKYETNCYIRQAITTMKGTNLGELEELILLMVASLYDDAYGNAIQKSISTECNRTISISTVHAVLQRLEKKGYLQSRYGGETKARGGRRKHLFTVTKAGQEALAYSKELRNRLWDSIPKMAFG